MWKYINIDKYVIYNTLPISWVRGGHKQKDMFLCLIREYGHQIYNTTTIGKKVQDAKAILALLFFATLFLIIRYRKKQDSGEWCCFLCGNRPFSWGLSRKKLKFSVLDKAFTAFAYRIRAPPSEI